MSNADLLRATLDLLILDAPRPRSDRGFGVSRRVDQITGSTVVVQSGPLFPAVQRFEERGWLRASWGDSEDNRDAKTYRSRRAAANISSKTPTRGGASRSPFSAV